MTHTGHTTRTEAEQPSISLSSPTMQAMCTSQDPDLFRSLLARVGDKWTLLLIGILGERKHRFTELAGAVPGISRRMLTVTLRALERDGLVERVVFAEVPPRVEYDLTDLGRSLQDVVLTLGEWVLTHQHTITARRNEFDDRMETTG